MNLRYILCFIHLLPHRKRNTRENLTEQNTNSHILAVLSNPQRFFERCGFAALHQRRGHSMNIELFGSALSALGSIASLISIIFIVKRENKRIFIALLLILALTTSSSYYSYKYFQSTNDKYILETKKFEFKSAAKSFVNTYPSLSYWEPGQNEGVANSGLLLLEMYKDLFPETYLKIKKDFENDTNFSKENRDQAGQRQSLETAAKNIYTLIKAASN